MMEANGRALKGYKEKNVDNVSKTDISYHFDGEIDVHNKAIF